MKRLCTIIAMGALLCIPVAAEALTLKQAQEQCSLGPDHQAVVTGCTFVLSSPKTDASTKSAAYLSRANTYFLQGDYTHARKDQDEAVRLQPDNADAYFARSLTYSITLQTSKALDDLGTVLRLRPDDVTALHSRAMIHYAMFAFDKALPDINEALRLTPDNALFLSSRGLIHAARDDYASAVRDYDAALRLNPGDADLRRSRDEAAAKITQAGGVVAAAAPTASPVDQNSEAGIIFGERRIALVIGNSAYQAVPILPNPARDAELVAEALRKSDFVDVTVLHDLDRSGMVAALRDFAEKADKADWAMVYYAGHGIEIGGVNYLIPVDAKLNSDRDVADESVSLERLLGTVEGASKLRLVVLDACRNNPFAPKMKRTSATRAIGRGLTRIEPDNGTLVVYAAKEGTTATDGDGANSPFAAAIARRIAEPGIEINMTFRLVRQDVLDATGRTQEPFTYGSLPPQGFYFTGRHE